jgi:hypothetical protein
MATNTSPGVGLIGRSFLLRRRVNSPNSSLLPYLSAVF